MNSQPNVRGLLFLFIAIVSISVGFVYVGCWIDGYCPAKSVVATTEYPPMWDCREGSAGCCRPRLQKDQSWEIECEPAEGLR